jgi:thioredoxin 1
MAKLTEVTTQNFDLEVLQSAQPVIVDFMAPWCAPCRMLAPLLERVAEQYSGQIKLVQMDTDVYPDTAARYGVQKIPNLTFIKDGHVVDQAIGYVSETELIEKIQALLKS